GWNSFEESNAGFHSIETYHGVAFRWSEMAAIMPAWIAAGQHRIRIECLPVRSLEGIKFFFNERPIEDNDILVSWHSIEFTIDIPGSGSATLAWVCPPFSAADNPAQLGIPVIRILSRVLRSPIETGPIASG